MGLGRLTSTSITHIDLHKLNNKLVSAYLEHFWCKNESRANLDSKDSPWSKLGGSHHLPPYSILSASPRGPHPNDILSRDSQVGVPKFPNMELMRFWEPITLCVNHRSKWVPKQSCSPHQKLFNGMLHVLCTPGNQGDSWFLMIGSQITNLIHGPSFGHNLCFRCPNGSCEPVSDIYVPRAFQWYNEIFNPMKFDPWNCPLKIQKSTKTPTPKMGVHLRVWGFIPSHSFALLGAWYVTLGPSLDMHLCKPLLWS
jgi:hypothetical protein